MICNIDNIASYAIPHDSANVLSGGSLSTSIVKRVCLVGQEVEGNARQYFEVMGEGVNLVFYARVIVGGIVVKVIELRGVQL